MKCHDLLLFHQVYIASGMLIVGALMIIRVYALNGRDRRILVFLLVFAFVAYAVAFGAVVTGIFTNDTVAPAYTMGLCDLGLSAAEGKFFAGAYGMVLVFETIILSLTLIRRLWSESTEGNSLYALMIRDGIMYFAIIAVLYAINIVIFVAAGPLYKGNTVTYSSVYVTTTQLLAVIPLTNHHAFARLSSVLMNRMMLNLRSHPQSPHSSQHTTATTTNQLTAMEYATVELPTNTAFTSVFEDTIDRDVDMIPMTDFDDTKTTRTQDHHSVV
ncbi:hypothetical protein EIP91_010720 [Steccherinum ochraceum]|uniref:Uncharacterized protein n=1 Tax=Steccherinum ochraceum TaxID=92696 RepID=A0A4R0R099_9APHY|nr:hypothetical protein EIP91_010720 [Steccherinum ochraceum]